MLDPLVAAAFSIYSGRGIYALLIGSGVSRPAGIPTGWEIVSELIADLARMEGTEPLPTPFEWYRTRFGEEPAYGSILARVAPLPAERRNVLRPFFEPAASQTIEHEKRPTAAHKAIADLVVGGFVRVVLTPNFDRLIESALTTAGANFQVVSSSDAIEGMQPLSHAGCTVIKVNGDYLDARIRNTAGELEEYDPQTAALLDRIFDEFGLIVCGWSADWDVALRSALQRKASRRYSVYWTVRSAPSPLTVDLISGTRANKIPIQDANEFLPALVDKVEALRAVEAPHPLSPQMAVANLKTFIEEHKPIKLNDLFVTETERLYSAMGQPNLLDTATGIDATSLKLRLDRYQSATNTLAALVAHGSRWGDDYRELYLRSIQRIANPPGTWSGVTIWLNLRRYPALLLFYSAGISAVWQNNIEFLKSLFFDVKVRNSSGSKSSPLDALLVYDVLHHDAVQLLFAPQRRRTPFSDIVHDAMRESFRDLIPDHDEYSDMFDRFEILLALVFSDVHENLPGAPSGRFAWRRRDGESLLETIKTEQLAAGESWGLFRADFFSGSLERFDKALKTVAASASQAAFR